MSKVRERRSGLSNIHRGVVATLMVVCVVLLITPQAAQAWPTKYTSCSSCHTASEPTANLDVAIDAVQTTGVTVAPGGSFEVDYIVRNIAGSGVLGLEIAVPTGWTIGAGTANTPALTGWNTVWDGASGGVLGWMTANMYDASAEFPNSTDGYTINFDTSGWDSGNRNAAFDDASAADLDGVANTMGTDATIGVPGGTGNGTYYIQVTGVGHNVGGTKAFISQTITVTVSGGDATAPVANNDVAVSVESGIYVPAAFDVTATFNEPESSVSSCEYTLDGAAWNPGVVSGAGPYTCTANVTGQVDTTALTINMRATSIGGGPTASTAINRTVDAAAPTTSDDVPAGWQTSDVTVTLTPADAGSGIGSTNYCVDQANSCSPVTSYAAPFLVSIEDTNYVRYSSTDNLGNAQTVVSKTLQIDKTAPTDGALTPTPGDTQIQLDWTAASDVTSGLTSPAYKVVMATGTTTPPADCSGSAIYTGDLLTHTQTGLTNGLDYAFRVCAYDAAGLVSTGATATAQPSVVCTNSDPTVTITNANKQITAGSGNVVYNVDVTNNDTVSCGDTTFSLSVTDSNATDFATSVLGTANLLVSPGTTQSTTLTVAAVASPTNGSINDTSVTSAAAGPHAQVTSNTVNTLINIPGTPTMHYNVGDTVHFEYRTSTQFNNNGTAALTVRDSSQVAILNAVNMTETQSGANWIYAYDWDTTGQPADTYTLEISDSDTTPTAMATIVLGNATFKVSFFADAAYTTPSSVFADTDTVYVEVILPSSETTTLSSDLESYYNGLWTPTLNVTETGTRYRFDFVVDFASAGIANGDWGYLYWEGSDTGLWFHEPIKRSDAGCGTCTYTDPTVSIVTGNQTINTDGGSVNYTINVTNNDTAACGSTAFDLTAVDTDTTIFAATGSTFTSDPLNVSPGATGVTDLTVSAQAGNVSGSNNTYFYTVADVNHGQSLNSNTVTTTLDVPDITAPNVLITNPTNGGYINAGSAEPIAVTGTSSDDRGTVVSADVQIDGGAWNPTSTSDGYANWSWNWAGAADGVHTVDARASDGTNTGNATQVSVTVDRTDPTTSDNIVAAWTATDRTVTLTESDATSGISSTVYCVDTANSCAPGTAYAAPFAVTQTAGQETVQYARYYSTDVAGNSQTLVSKAVNIDKKAPVDGAVLTPTPGDGQITLNWNAATDGGSGLEPTNTYKVVQVAGTTPPADCSAVGIYTGSALTTIDTGLTNGNDYAYRVCAYDNVGQVSTGLTATAQPNAACVRNTPSVTLSANQDITVDNGFVDYTITVTNNDSGGCAAQTFDVQISTDSGASFTYTLPNGSTTGSIGVGANDTSLVARVTANVGALNGATHTAGIQTNGAADPNHGNSLEDTAVTTMNVPCNVQPTVSWLTANQDITTDGGNAVYNIQVQNDNAVACGSTDFDLVLVDDNGVAFSTPSVFGTDPLTVAPNGGTNSTTITVTAQGGATNGATNNTYFYTAVNGTIPQSGNSPVRTTTLNRPCVRNAPSFSHAVNQNIAPDGTAIYTLTVINNDVDCADTTFNLTVDSEVESNTAAFDEVASDLSTTSVTVAAGATDKTVTYSAVGTGSGVENDTLTTTITLSDAVNHSGQDQTTIPVTTLKNINPLIHSSLSTASTKHSGDGGWGVAGGRYGEFACGTCHSNNKADTGSNIKRIRDSITTPNTAIATLPGDGLPVNFLDAAEPTTDFGDDSTAPRASSNRICEICHTYDATKAAGTNKHAFNQQVTTSHEDSKDCTACHKHSAGFAAAGGTCDSCHGYPPSPGDASTTPARTDDGKAYQAVEGKGAHVEHVNHLAALVGVSLDPNVDSFGDANTSAICGVCHDMTPSNHEMGGGNRNINFYNSTVFQFGSVAPLYNGVQGVGSATTPKTCSNISCHFQGSPWWE